MSLIIHKVSSETFAFRTDPHVLHPEIVNKYQAVDDHDLFVDDHGLFRDICIPCWHQTVDEIDHPHVLHEEFVSKAIPSSASRSSRRRAKTNIEKNNKTTEVIAAPSTRYWNCNTARQWTIDRKICVLVHCNTHTPATEDPVAKQRRSHQVGKKAHFPFHQASKMENKINEQWMSHVSS